MSKYYYAMYKALKVRKSTKVCEIQYLLIHTVK